MIPGLLQTRPLSALPCVLTHQPRRSACRSPVYAATNNDKQQPKKPEPLSGWEELLQQQQQQFDNYQPPPLVTEVIDNSKDKFLGRLATLILGVRSLLCCNSSPD